MISIMANMHKHFASWPNTWLSLALLLVAGVLIVVALLPDHEIFKAIVLAWTVLP